MVFVLGTSTQSRRKPSNTKHSLGHREAHDQNGPIRVKPRTPTEGLGRDTHRFSVFGQRKAVGSQLVTTTQTRFQLRHTLQKAEKRY